MQQQRQQQQQVCQSTLFHDQTVKLISLHSKLTYIFVHVICHGLNTSFSIGQSTKALDNLKHRSELGNK